MRAPVSRSPSGTWASVIAIVARPTGTFTKKIHSQPRCSVITPPMTGPTATEKPVVAPHSPIAVPRSLGGNSWAISASEVANIIAPPRPWTARAMFSTVGVPARPQTNEAATNRPIPVRKTSRRPSRSPSEPAASRMLARPSA